MARKKVEPNFLMIDSWDEADDTLHRIGELIISRRLAEARAQIRINEIREELKNSCNPLDQEIGQLELGLKEFCEIERKAKDFKTRVLTFGSVFFRKSTSLVTLKGIKWQQVVERLAARRLVEFLKITHAVRKEELRDSGLSDTELAALGVKIEVEEPFKYEINEEKFKNVEPATEPPARRTSTA